MALPTLAEAPPAVAVAEVAPQPQVVELDKGDASKRIGLTLSGVKGAPKVTSIVDGGVAQLSNRLNVGMKLLAVNGQQVDGHADATTLIKEASGKLSITVVEEE